MSISANMVFAIAIDLVAITILAGPLYFRRHRRRDLMLSYFSLNVGVLGVAIALSGSEVGVGLGLGLFGVLSIVRLRSDQITQSEIAYYFTSLALGLLAGIGAASVWMPVVFSALMLGVLYVVDHPRLLPTQRRRVVTLDRAYLDDAALRAAVADTVGGAVTRMEVLETDLVRDTTVVDVRYRLTRPAAALRRDASGYPAGAHGYPAGASGHPAAAPAPAPVPMAVPQPGLAGRQPGPAGWQR